MRQSLSRQHGAFQSLEDQNNDLFDVFRRTHVSDGFVCSSPDGFRGFTCGDEFHLGAEGAVAAIALEDGITKGLGSIIECVHAFLHLGGMGGGCRSCRKQLYMCEIVAMNSSQLPIR